MSDSPRQVIEDFKREKWKSDPLTRSLDLATRSPAHAEEIAQLVLEECSEGGAFLGGVLCYLDVAAWPRVVATALDLLARGRCQAAEAVIAHAALQSLESLHPHLERLFSLAPPRSTDYENWIWRESEDRGFSFLAERFRDPDPETRLKAWESLLETRSDKALGFAVAHWSQVGHPASMSVNNYLNEVGFELTEADGLRRLYREQPFHLCFSSPYLPDEASHRHPTWTLKSAGGLSAPFGGITQERCAWCDGQLHRLLVLDPACLDARWQDLGQLCLATCMSCLGWERNRMFVRHEFDGSLAVVPGEGQAAVEPQFPSSGLEPTTITLVSAGDRWKWQDWAQSSGRENLHRVGGHPSWIQGADYPSCPECGTTMHFLMQLDSNLREIGGGEWVWGSGGVLYAFLCAPCRMTGYHWQCT